LLIAIVDVSFKILCSFAVAIDYYDQSWRRTTPVLSNLSETLEHDFAHAVQLATAASPEVAY